MLLSQYSSCSGLSVHLSPSSSTYNHTTHPPGSLSDITYPLCLIPLGWKRWDHYSKSLGVPIPSCLDPSLSAPRHSRGRSALQWLVWWIRSEMSLPIVCGLLWNGSVREMKWRGRIWVINRTFSRPSIQGAWYDSCSGMRLAYRRFGRKARHSAELYNMASVFVQIRRLYRILLQCNCQWALPRYIQVQSLSQSRCSIRL
jgi:hypothetical protein